LLLAASLLFTLSACDSPLSNPAADAAAAFEAQDYLAARDHAQAALREDSGSAEALELLVRAQIAVGEGANALATLDRLKAAGGAPADAGLLEAEANLQVGETDAVLALLEGDDSAESWRLRALAASLMGDDAGAQQAFAAGRAAQGDKVRLYAAEASWFLARGNADGARAAVALAQQAAPKRLETLFITARLAQIDGDSDMASRAFLAILEMAPNDRPALLGAIAEMGALGRVDLLRPLVERGSQSYPGDPEFIFLTARLLAQDGNWAGVRDMLQAREASLAAHPDSRGLYAEALVNLGQVELARTHIAPLYLAHAENPQVARVYARVMLEAGDRAEALRAIAPVAASPNALPEDQELAARASRG
jgi:hypothetical protein